MKNIIILLVLLSINGLAIENSSLNSLQNEVKELKKVIKELRLQQNSLEKKQEQTRADLDESLDYTESVETRVLEDKLKFGLGFKTNLDNFSKKYVDGHGLENTNIWSNKLMLNIKANITDNMQFDGRLSMYKYWGSSIQHPYSSYDNMQGRVPSDSSIYVERAYINWFLNRDGYIPLAITIGRQPSADGPSQQFKDNTTRKATYSSLLYDGAADGAVLTLNLSNVVHNKKSFLRFGYAKGFGYTESVPDVINAYIGSSNNDLKDTNIYGVFFDTTVPTLNHSLFQLSYSIMKDIIANPLDSNSTQNKNLGDAELYGAMIEITNLKDLNLDLFAHYGHSIAYPNANSYGIYGGLLSSMGDTSSKVGDAIWLGGRYGFGSHQKYKIGFEYNKGSKNWISLTQGSFDVYNKLATRGDAYEAYLMYVINRYANIRLGFVNIDYKYSRSGWFVGESKLVKDVAHPENELDKLNSIYLKMSINY